MDKEHQKQFSDLRIIVGTLKVGVQIFSLFGVGEIVQNVFL